MKLDRKTANIINILAFLLLCCLLIGCNPVSDNPTERGLKKQITWQKDGAEMSLIPAGSFNMGDENITYANPVHLVTLDAFYMDVREVTVKQFKKFVQESGYIYNHWDDVSKYSPTDQNPMIYVDWYQAMEYAKWAGKRLPTEAEWEYAARGGLVKKQYPWGDKISHDNANYAGVDGKDIWDQETAPVASFPPNGYGLYDMAGNVHEWCLDVFDHTFYSQRARKNPIAGHPSIEGIVTNYNEDASSARVLRSGGWTYSKCYVSVAYRDYANTDHRFNTGGFRCVLGLTNSFSSDEN